MKRGTSRRVKLLVKSHFLAAAIAIISGSLLFIIPEQLFALSQEELIAGAKKEGRLFLYTGA